ncbi:XRCC6, partial [Symbiodinium microadriaticum]
DLVDRSDAASISELFTGQTGEVLCPLKEALWLCTQSFNVKGSVVHPSDFKRVWIFTNDDNPNGGDIAEQNSIVQVAKDGSETGVEISLWHMDTHEGKHFEISQFYHRLLTVDEEDGANESAYEHRVMGASGGGFDEMMDLAKRKEYKKRRLGNVRMYIAGGNERESPSTPAADVQVAVGIYKTVMPAVRPTYEWLQASTNEPALKASTMIDTSTGQVITQAESTLTSQPSLTTYIEVAGSRVPFCRDEMTNCRRLSVAAQKPDNDINHEESILKILFFVPASTLTMDMNLTAPCMISPDENSIKGSTNLFAALAHCMLQRALIGIGAFCRTKSSMPRLVALLPHLEPTDGADSTIFGLDLVTIPYSNEVRPVECMDLGGVGDEPLSNDEKNAAHNIVRAMQFADGFQYQELQSPAIQYMYAVLQAVALNQ